MKSKISLILIGVFCTLASCRTDKSPLPEESNFFPLQIGKYIIYDYKKIIHDPLLQTSDTTYLLQQEIIEDTIIDLEGQTNYKLGIYQSIDSGLSWEFINYALLYKTSETAFRLEDDIRKAKLSFPLRERKTWDINNKNSLDFQRARMIDINEDQTFIGVTYKNTLTVDLGEEIDPFFQFKELEIYASGIGLAYREYQNLETQPDKYINGIEIYKTIYSTNW